MGAVFSTFAARVAGLAATIIPIVIIHQDVRAAAFIVALSLFYFVLSEMILGRATCCCPCGCLEAMWVYEGLVCRACKRAGHFADIWGPLPPENGDEGAKE